LIDAIVGLDLLKQAGVPLGLASGHLKWGNEVEKVEFQSCFDVNFTNVDCFDASPLARDAFVKMLGDRKEAFANPNEALPYNTSVDATIRTVSEEPIYAKLYPYPMGAADFVNSEIQDLLKNGIIQKSKSILQIERKDDTRSLPYAKHLYETSLGNFGKARYFTTLDLKSGYHQVTLAERDREKTSFSVNGGKYEFRRLTFGLKNAASIFQRIVIVFSEDENAHIRYVDWVLKSLHDSNMRVSAQKSRFFKKKKRCFFGIHCHQQRCHY